MKYYTVWEGHQIGVFNTWDQCCKAIKGYSGALYKSFHTHAAAEEAFNSDPLLYVGKSQEETERLKREDIKIVFGDPIADSICTGGFYDRKSNSIAYWGVDTHTGKIVFEKKNIGGGNSLLSRFLPIVHALAHLKNKSIIAPVYTRNRQVVYYVNHHWYEKLFYQLDSSSDAYKILQRAVLWLSNNEVNGNVLLWDDRHWGDMPGLYYDKRED